MIIFTETKRKADKICGLLRSNGLNSGAMHGDKSQKDREYILNGFRNRTLNILVATDVASRGLDVDDIKYVVNYDFPNQFEDYIHRIGRTARSGKSGMSYTFFNRKSVKSVGALIKIMEDANQMVPDCLYDMAYIPKDRRKQHYQVSSSANQQPNGYSRPQGGSMMPQQCQNLNGFTRPSQGPTAPAPPPPMSYSSNGYKMLDSNMESCLPHSFSNHVNDDNRSRLTTQVNKEGGVAPPPPRVSRFGDRVNNNNINFFNSPPPLESPFKNGCDTNDWKSAPPPLPPLPQCNGGVHPATAISSDNKLFDPRFNPMGFYGIPPQLNNGLNGKAFSNFE